MDQITKNCIIRQPSPCEAMFWNVSKLDLNHIFLRTLLLYQSVKPKTTFKHFVFTILTSQKDVDQTKSDIQPVTAYIFSGKCLYFSICPYRIRPRFPRFKLEMALAQLKKKPGDAKCQCHSVFFGGRGRGGGYRYFYMLSLTLLRLMYTYQKYVNTLFFPYTLYFKL